MTDHKVPPELNPQENTLFRMLDAAPIIFKDDHLMILAKPAGVVVNTAETTSAYTIQSWLQTQPVSPVFEDDSWRKLLPAGFDETYGSPIEIWQQRQGIVHRLDKDTSGVLVIARHPASLLFLLQLFRERLVEKEYSALVHGKFQIPEGTFSSPIGRSSINRTRFTIRADGREAITRYRVEEWWPHFVPARAAAVAEKLKIALPPNFVRTTERTYQGFSLVRCWPKTGRTHQIRVHLAAAQHPLVGDIVYSGKKRRVVDSVWCPRQFLHAAKIQFTHPITQQELVIAAPLPSELQTALECLQN